MASFGIDNFGHAARCRATFSTSSGLLVRTNPDAMKIIPVLLLIAFALPLHAVPHENKRGNVVLNRGKGSQVEGRVVMPEEVWLGHRDIHTGTSGPTAKDAKTKRGQGDEFRLAGTGSRRTRHPRTQEPFLERPMRLPASFAKT